MSSDPRPLARPTARDQHALRRPRPNVSQWLTVYLDTGSPRDVLLDALLSVSATQWHQRGAEFEAVTGSDDHDRYARCMAIATACRRHAELPKSGCPDVLADYEAIFEEVAC